MAGADFSFLGNSPSNRDVNRWRRSNQVPESTFRDYDTAPPPSPIGGQFGIDPGPSSPFNVSDPGQWRDKETRGALKSYLENWRFPAAQLAQNAYQYGQDFGENRRRFDEEMRWRQVSDRYSMGIAGRQQTLAEQSQAEAARQWQQQFGFQQSQWGDQFGLNTRAEDRLLEQTRGELDIGRGRLGVEQQLADIEGRRAGIQQMDAETRRQLANTEEGRRMIQQYDAQTRRQLAGIEGGRLGVERGQLGVQRMDARTRQRLAQIDQAYKTGLIDNEQARQLMEQAQFEATETRLESQFGREISQRDIESLRLQQTERERIAAQIAMANIQAYGRQQAPNLRWLSSS